MPAVAQAKNGNKINPEEFFDAEDNTSQEIIEQQRAAELKKVRAAEKRQMAQEAMGAQTKIPTPEEREAELIEQEYGKPIGNESLEEGMDQETEEDGESTPGGYAEGEEPDAQKNDSLESQQKSAQMQRASLAQQQKMQAMQKRSINLNRQIRNANVTMEKKLEPTKKLLRMSELKDRSINLSKNTAALGRIGIALWYTIIIPLIMLLAILGCFILWLCGFNLGPPSAKTFELKQKLRSQKQILEREKNRQIQPIQRELQKINREINQSRINLKVPNAYQSSLGLQVGQQNLSRPKKHSRFAN